MAVASPYAVFRAVDLGWPLAMPASREPVPSPASAATHGSQATPRKRSTSGLRRRRAPQWNTLIQGELFPA